MRGAVGLIFSRSRSARYLRKYLALRDHAKRLYPAGLILRMVMIVRFTMPLLAVILLLSMMGESVNL